LSECIGARACVGVGGANEAVALPKATVEQLTADVPDRPLADVCPVSKRERLETMRVLAILQQTENERGRNWRLPAGV